MSEIKIKTVLSSCMAHAIGSSVSSRIIPELDHKKHDDTGSVKKTVEDTTSELILVHELMTALETIKRKMHDEDDDYDDTDDTDEDAHIDASSYTRSVSFCGKKIDDLVHMASEKKSEDSEKRTSQWEDLMRKFSEAHKEECKAVPVNIPRAPRSAKHFPTGSMYEGSWDILGMSGYGTYTFPNGVVYSGDFEDGMFQGDGELRYPDGTVLRGTWKKGRMVDKSLVFADGLEYNEDDWKYCKMPDRRFSVEYEKGLQPSGKTFQTADQPTRKVPDEYYDTGDGFFHPKTKIIYSADNITDIVRSTGPIESKWIVSNCRTSSDEAVGPHPELYEEWSEPQTDPEPPPPPAASKRSNRRDTEFSDDINFDDEDDVFYETMRKSRTSCVLSRSDVTNDKPIITLHSAPIGEPHTSVSSNESRERFFTFSINKPSKEMASLP